MKKSVVKAVAIVLCMAMIITTFSFVFFLPAAFGATEEKTVPNRSQKEKEEILLQRLNALYDYIEFLDENYKDKVDINDLIDGAFSGATSALDDRFSEYYPTTEELQGFMNSVDKSFGGVGVSVGINAEGEPYVESLLEGPAKKVGLQVGDVFVNIDGQNVQDSNTSEVVALLRGEIGTGLKVTIRRNMILMDFIIVRDSINAQSVYITTIDKYPGAAYVEIRSFDSDTASEFENALETLKAKGIKKVALDLRNNGGGYVNEAIKVVDSIVEGGFILHYQTQGKITSSVKADDGKKSDIQFVVVVNEETASAAELMAAALKDHGYKLVGTNTYGKDYAQTVKMLADGTFFKASVEYFLSPNKTNYQTVGIVPNVTVRNAVVDEETIASRIEAYRDFAILDGKTKCQTGDLHLNVYGAQQRLKLMGYDVSLSGKMDAKTVKAIKDFQTSAGLYAYAILDITTQVALEQATIDFVTGVADLDYQLLKAFELLGYK